MTDPDPLFENEPLRPDDRKKLEVDAAYLVLELARPAGTRPEVLDGMERRLAKLREILRRGCYSVRPSTPDAEYAAREARRAYAEAAP